MTSLARSAVLGLGAACLLTASAAAAQSELPPKLDILLAPHANGDDSSYIGVTMTFQAPALKAGDPLVRAPLKLVGVPMPRFDGDAIQARDDAGPLPLTQAEEPPTPQGVYRRWSLARASVGDVVVSYKAAPRKVSATTNNGPLFDVREQAGGFAGSGNGLLATPVAPGPWRLHLAWDLSSLAPGSRGVWSLGEGTVDTVAPSDTLAFSYYYAGPMKSYPPEGDPRFAFYWLEQPGFDPAEFGGKMKSLFSSMATFFNDEGGSYRVFMRRNPYAGTGGTALARSFMFGYPPSNPPLEDLQGLVSHEMAHTWPGMQGEHGDTSWYSEGMAEYYSTILSWRAKAISTDRLVKTFNERANAYYSNPYLRATTAEAAKKFWTDPVAQTVPYGRGWMYLQQVDAQIRKASRGKRSLDDVAKEMRSRQVAEQPYDAAVWLELVGKEIGVERAKAGYDFMMGGGVLNPPADLYAPCLVLQKHPVRPFQLGFARSSMNEDRVIRDLEAGSAAEAAGVRNGDVIVQASDINLVRKDETVELKLTLRRGASTLDVSYLPRGVPVQGYNWVRNLKTSEAACRF